MNIYYQPLAKNLLALDSFCLWFAQFKWLLNWSDWSIINHTQNQFRFDSVWLVSVTYNTTCEYITVIWMFRTIWFRLVRTCAFMLGVDDVSKYTCGLFYVQCCKWLLRTLSTNKYNCFKPSAWNSLWHFASLELLTINLI